jgi:hypothetical protein
MSKWEDRAESGKEGTGPNLWVAYTLLGLSLLAAMGIAAAIIYPFYLRR